MPEKTVASFDHCDHAHRVTITLPKAMSPDGRQKYLDWLRDQFWQHTQLICWVSHNTVRLIAKAGKDLMENMVILKQYAEKTVRRLNKISTASA